MSDSEGTTLPSRVRRNASRLRFPKLFALVLLLFLIDLIVPDFIPFVDEIILGLLSLMLGMLRKKAGATE